MAYFGKGNYKKCSKAHWTSFPYGIFNQSYPRNNCVSLAYRMDTITYIAHTKLLRANFKYYFYYFSYTKRIPIAFVILESVLALSQVDLFLAWKILPPIFYGLLGIAVFYFLNKRFSLNVTKAMIGTIFVLLAVPSLRISWDLHKNALANAFLILRLTYFDSRDSMKKSFSYLFIILALFTHQLVGAQIVIIISLYLLTTLVTKSFKENEKDVLEKALLLVFGLFLTSFYMGYYPPRNDFIISVTANAPASIIDADLMLLSSLTLFLIYFFLYIPYFYKKKDKICYMWIAASLLPGLSPLLMVTHLSYWYRWLLQAIYPMAMLSWAAVTENTSEWSTSIKNFITKLPSIEKTIRNVFILTLFLGITYEVLPPTTPFPIFANPLTVEYVPTTMLQNTMPLSENPNMISALEWVKSNVPEGSLIITVHPFYAWALIFLGNKTYHIKNVEFNITLATRIAQTASSSQVYLIAPRRGCYYYSIFVPLNYYKEIYTKGEISVYLFVK